MKPAIKDSELGFCSLSALDRPLAEAAGVVASLGFDGIEVSARPPHLAMGADDAAVDEAARAVGDAGSRVLAYGSYLGHPPFTSPEQARREVQVALGLDTRLLRVWAGTAESSLEEVVAMLCAACDEGAGEGVTVVVERHVGSWADTPERCERLLEAAGRPNLALNYQTLDFLPAEAAAEQPEDALRLAPFSRYLHLKNYRVDPESGRLVHGASLEAGALDLRALLAAAARAGYAGPLAIEFVSFEDRPLEEKLAADLRWLRRTLAELAP